MIINERLEVAIGNGEILSVIYHGGSNPGKARQIAPIAISGDTVRARSFPSGVVKSFKIAKIEICGEGNLVYATRTPPASEQKKTPTFNELASGLIDTLEGFGWHVEVEDAAISVHSFFKNGKPKKGADAGVMLNPMSGSRPWYVYGPGLKTAKTFSDLEKAVSAFMEQASNYAPANR